jgi:putative ABC transport system permease protein
MLRIAWTMLVGDRGKYAGLLFGIAFTSFLVTFAVSFFCGFMTRGFALISDNPAVDVWVMDPAVESVERTIDIPDSALERVRSVTGVSFATPLGIADVVARFPNGRFQSFQLISVDDATLAGVPLAAPEDATRLRAPDAVFVAAGGSEGKLEFPRLAWDRWPKDGPHLSVPTRPLIAGDQLLANDRRVVVAGYAQAAPRFPPRPLMYTTLPNAVRILPPERHRTTFVMATALPGVEAGGLARRIERETGLRARTTAEFKEDTVRWNLVNSEDVGDVGAMLTLAMTVGFGVTAVLLYLFTTENLPQYATLEAMGATSGMLLAMVFVQAGACALLGTGLGLGLCSIAGSLVAAQGFPFRMLWFAPVAGAATVFVVSVVAALVSARSLLGTEPGKAFTARV